MAPSPTYSLDVAIRSDGVFPRPRRAAGTTIGVPVAGSGSPVHSMPKTSWINEGVIT